MDFEPLVVLQCLFIRSSEEVCVLFAGENTIAFVQALAYLRYKADNTNNLLVLSKI